MTAKRKPKIKASDALIRIVITKEANCWRCVRERKPDPEQLSNGESGTFDTLEECFDFIRAYQEKYDQT